MTVTKVRLEAVIAELAEAIIARAARRGRAPRLRPNPGASEQEIAAFERHLGLRLPPSFRMFLELHDGYEGLAAPGDMLPSRELLPGGSLHDTVRDWKLSNAKYGMGEVLDGVMIANLAEPNNWVFLDPNQPAADGELTVIEWLNGDTSEYPDMVAYFESRILYCQTD